MFISIDNKRIHYELINEQWISDGKTLLVFLHEGLGSIPQWKGFPEQLSNRLQLPALVYERQGYGESDFWDNGEIKSRFLHHEALLMLPLLIQKLNFDNPIIIFGHSDGGTIALIHASEPLANVKAVIVEAPHVFLEEHSLNGIRKARAILNNNKLVRVLDRYHQARAGDLIDKWTAHWLAANDTDWEASSSLKKIIIPLLLIQGDDDDFGTFAQIDMVAQLAESTIIEVAQIKDCGHVPHLQKQEEILKLAQDFINKI